jgi:D-beta-D-heptose 7-phosphate kinase/D-beta-D-heptose 1-phosphate adenosyltransferase
VHLLDEAARLGDILVVGINSDASTTRLKGPTRPLQPQADRLRVLAAARFVDYATVCEQDTPLDLILTIRPDVIVKGADYRAEDVVGGAEALAWGGVVRTVSLVEGVSTTRLSGQAPRA